MTADVHYGVKPSTGPKKVAGVAVTSKRVTILVIAVAVIWFILVDTQRISIRLWVPHITRRYGWSSCSLSPAASSPACSCSAATRGGNSTQ